MSSTHPYYLPGVSGTFSPADADATNWSWVQDISDIRKLVHGKTSPIADHAQADILRLLTNRSAAQRQQIYLQYKTTYKKDLLEKLRKCLDGMYGDVLEILLSDPVDYDIKMIHQEALGGAGMNADLLAEIVCTKTVEQLKILQDKHSDNQSQSLLDFITEARLKGTEKEFVRKLLSQKTTSTDVNDEKAQSDAQILQNACAPQSGIDREKFMSVILPENTNVPQIQATIKAFKDVTNNDIVDVTKEGFDGAFKPLMLTYIRCKISTQKFYAEKIYEAVKGSDDDTLIRIIVGRCEVDLKEIIAIYKEQFKQMFPFSDSTAILKDLVN